MTYKPSMYPTDESCVRDVDLTNEATTDFRKVRADFETWKLRICNAFGLSVPVTEIVVETGTNCLESRYRCEYSAKGLRHEIAFHERRIFDEWGTPNHCLLVGDLAHLLFHVHDMAVGNATGCDDHNPKFLAHAAEFGLIIDAAGVTHFATNSPFTQLLEANRLRTDSLFDPEAFLSRELQSMDAKPA